MTRTLFSAYLDLIDIHELLNKKRQIAHVWSIEDVQTLRPELSDDQAWEILQSVDSRKDATVGINWDVLQHHADEIFP